MRLLVVEDEPLLARRLTRGLEEEGYAVDTAPTARTAYEQTVETEYDLILLDLVLPDRSGIDLLARWRREGLQAPVLVVTARDSVGDKVTGLDAGADDYLAKPFSFDELLARIRSLLRRRGTPALEVLAHGGLRLDRTRRTVEAGGAPVALTAKEFALLEHLMLRPGSVVTRDQIAEHVWDDGYDARTNVIDVIVGRLRRKLEQALGRRLIHTVRGSGYVLREEGEA